MRWRVLSCILAFFLFITLILLARNGEGEKLQLISWLPSMTSSRKRFFIFRLLFETSKSSSWAWLEIKGWTSNILYISYIFWCIAMQKYWFTIYPACMLKACGLGNKTIRFGRGGLSFLKEFPLSPTIYPAFFWYTVVMFCRTGSPMCHMVSDKVFSRIFGEKLGCP